VFLKNDSTEYGERLLARVRTRCTFLPAYRSLSGTIASSANSRNHGARQGSQPSQIATIIVLISGVVLRSFLRGILVAIKRSHSAVWSTSGVMGLLGIPLDIVDSPFAAMAVGSARTIRDFIFRFREELAVSRTPALGAPPARMQTCGKAIVYVLSALPAAISCCVSPASSFHLEFGHPRRALHDRLHLSAITLCRRFYC